MDNIYLLETCPRCRGSDFSVTSGTEPGVIAVIKCTCSSQPFAVRLSPILEKPLSDLIWNKNPFPNIWKIFYNRIIPFIFPQRV